MLFSYIRMYVRTSVGVRFSVGVICITAVEILWHVRSIRDVFWRSRYHISGAAEVAYL